jgi:hypothetical protein
MVSYIRGTDNFDSEGVGKNAAAGEVGSYAFVLDYAGVRNFGDTVAGSTIRPACLYKTGNYETAFTSTMGMGSNQGTLAGTWRVMAGPNYSGTRTYFFLALRIS